MQMCLLNFQRQIKPCPDLHSSNLKSKFVLVSGSFKPDKEVLPCVNTAVKFQSTGLASSPNTEPKQVTQYCFSHSQIHYALFYQLQLLQQWMHTSGIEQWFILPKLLLPGRAIKISWTSHSMRDHLKREEAQRRTQQYEQKDTNHLLLQLS